MSSPAPIENAGFSPNKLALKISGVCAVLGVLGTTLLGGVGMAALWAVPNWASDAPPGAIERALVWGALHGVLIGVHGIATGAIVGLARVTLAPRLSGRAASAALGGCVGMIVGGGCALELLDMTAAHWGAVVAVISHILVGAALSLWVRRMTSENRAADFHLGT